MKTQIGDSKFETLVLEVIKEDNMSEFVKAVSSFQYAYMHFSLKSDDYAVHSRYFIQP